MDADTRLTLVCQLKGGIGNQLFQIVFARGLAQKLGADLVYDDSYFQADPYGRAACLARLQAAARFGRIADFAGPGCYLLQDGQLRSLADPVQLPPDARALVLSGYWQQEALLEAQVVAEVAAQLAAAAQPSLPQDLAARIAAAGNAVAVHLRRRDYAHMGLCKAAYYCAAIEHLRRAYADAELFVCADEPNYARHLLAGRGFDFTLVDCGDDLADLHLMAQCRHFVIANSSYSWWAAYFGEARGGQVICPKEWVTIDATPSPCPPRWLQLADAVTPFAVDAAEVARFAAQLAAAPPPAAEKTPAYSNLIDLTQFFAAMPDYAVIKLPEQFPNYYDYQDIDILCRDVDRVREHILQVGSRYTDQGYAIREHRDGQHLHLDVYAPGAQRLNFRFDLLATLTGYRKFTVAPEFDGAVLDARRLLTHNGAQVWVPQVDHDLAIRCMEYLEWKDQIPAKKKHLDYIMQHNNSDFLAVISRYTNLVMPAAPASTPAPDAAAPRYDYLMIWGHGLPYTQEIMAMIRGRPELEIVAIVRRDIADMERFVRDVYACDTVPFHHLVAKTRYLLTTPAQIVFILVINHDPQEQYFGEGQFRHIQSQSIKELKEEIRNRYNPRLEDGQRSEHHVIHASDYPSQVEHLLQVLGLPPLAHYQREAHAEIDAPYHLGVLRQLAVTEVDIDSLYANIIGQGLVSVKETPHYRYVMGDRAAYLEYHDQHLGLELTDDHFADAFDEKIRNFSYGGTSRNGKRSLIVARPLAAGRYQILDGVHRAAILASLGCRRVSIAVADT